ncbi:hypothetical protein EJB05_55520, partial [Eragrostis curvula]
MSNNNACAAARGCLEVGPDPERRCKVATVFFAELALDMGSQDNISTIVVDLQNRADMNTKIVLEPKLSFEEFMDPDENLEIV